MLGKWSRHWPSFGASVGIFRVCAWSSACNHRLDLSFNSHPKERNIDNVHSYPVTLTWHWVNQEEPEQEFQPETYSVTKRERSEKILLFTIWTTRKATCFTSCTWRVLFAHDRTTRPPRPHLRECIEIHIFNETIYAPTSWAQTSTLKLKKSHRCDM